MLNLDHYYNLINYNINKRIRSNLRQLTGIVKIFQMFQILMLNYKIVFMFVSLLLNQEDKKATCLHKN
ncbi:hypothetical protein BpHYR1_009427 [Brachionus plicatilis]|uniref:Uncharacterized protein n=1 Tax=Brachionus plicatilis TaxID=10195 RepID=A0A3M7R5J6_BRAPC|nr:hypothetical protein BpHYR1_009427 [Brachionus plicatilis]